MQNRLNFNLMKAIKSARKILIKVNDDLFRSIIRLRDKVCQKSGRSENLQVCHFYTRSNLRVRWDYDNACLLQGGLHIFWAHKNPQAFREFWLKRLGQKKFDELEMRARHVSPIKDFDLACVGAQLQKILTELKNK